MRIEGCWGLEAAPVDAGTGSRLPLGSPEQRASRGTGIL